MYCLLLLLSFSIKSAGQTVLPAAHSTEPHRPVYHFTPPAKWMNDPNGMVYYEGEYHLFYQYYPEGTVWGPMHWGHAVSRDLVHWDHLPIALYPDSLGLIFSGSAVVDWHNTTGFGRDGKPPLVAIFTQHLMAGEKAGRNDFQCQSIAYSNDRGRTWTKYAGNPVIPNPGIRDFRDPKVIWHEASKQWVMVFAVADHVRFYGSPDLKKWRFLSDFGKEIGAHGGVWECPDLFPIKIDQTQTEKWVLTQSINPGSPNGGSGTQYFVGNFDGVQFTLDSEFAKDCPKGKGVWIDYGRDNYAGVTFSDIPKKDGRRLAIGWMSNWDYAQEVPTVAWRSAMTLPRQFTLKNTPAGLRLCSAPVRETERLRGAAYSIKSKPIEHLLNLSEKVGFPAGVSELMFDIELPEKSASMVGVRLSNAKGEAYRIGFDAGSNRFFSDRTRSGDMGFSAKFAQTMHYGPRIAAGSTVKMHLFFDRASCELFADDGLTVMTEIFFPTEDFKNLEIFTENGGVRVKNLKMWGLGQVGSGK
jgi:fructan beta-fructosidase